MIPVFNPSITDLDKAAVAAALSRGEISGGFGGEIAKFEEDFAAFIGCKYGIAVSSGTTALHLAVAALNIPKGSEILISSSTNIATALCAYHNSCMTVPIDIDAEDWNLKLDLIEQLITPNTKAIIVVHLYGLPVDMPRLLEIVERHRLILIEDCAEAHGATINSAKVGSFGKLSCFSFYANKIITTGEGGMLTTNDQGLAERCRLLRNLGTTHPRFLHNQAGFNFRLTGMQAALGRSQLTRINQLISERITRASIYSDNLSKLPWIKLQRRAPDAKHVYWAFGIQIDQRFNSNRDDLISYLLDSGIETRTAFCPMNLQPCLVNSTLLRNTDCPNAENLWKSGLYLPMGSGLTPNQITYITEKIAAWGELKGL